MGSLAACVNAKRSRNDEAEEARGNGSDAQPTGNTAPPGAMKIERDVASVSDAQRQFCDNHVDRLGAMVSGLMDKLDLKYQSISDIEKKSAEVKGLDQKFTQISVLGSSEAALMTNGNVCCLVCTANVAGLHDGRQLNSKFIAENGGYNVGSDLTTHWRKHMRSEMHAACVAHQKNSQTNALPNLFARARSRDDDVLKRLVNTAAYVSERKLSFREYEHLVKLAQ